MKLLTRVLVFLPLVILISNCDDGAGGCPEGQVECEDSVCQECCADENCLGRPGMVSCKTEYIICNDEHKCECVCYKEAEDCSRAPGGCCAGMACDVFTNTCMPECMSDEECTSRTEIDYYEDLLCKEGVCDFTPCTTDGACTGVCFKNDCVTVPACADLKECVVLPSSVVTQTGSTSPLVATAYVQHGSLAPGITFTWTSSDVNVASVDAGLVTGGATAGTATITASVESCQDISCTGSVSNYQTATVPRVVVIDDLTLTPVDGASVTAGAEAPVSSDGNGIALLTVEPSSTNPTDITVSHTDYQYATQKGVESSDVIIYLRKTEDHTKAGGITGKINFDMFRCEDPLQMCDVYLCITGLSVPGNLMEMAFELHRRWRNPETIKMTVELGGSQEDIRYPARNILGLPHVMFNDTFYLTGAPGTRIAWAVGGRIDLNWFVGDLGRIGPGEYTHIDWVRGLIGTTNKMSPVLQSGLALNLDINPIDKLIDAEDFDGDKEFGDLIPDYSRFPVQDMTLRIPATNTIVFTAPPLPVGIYDMVVLVAGVIVHDRGFVPLGIGADSDVLSSEDEPDGIIDDPITIHISPTAGRIPEEQVKRVVLAITLNAYSFASDEEEIEPLRLAAKLIPLDSFAGDHALPEFPLPAVTMYDPSTRRLEITGVPEGADYFQATFSDENGFSWKVLTHDSTSFDLLAAPPEGDRSAQVSFISVDLVDGVTYQDLVEFSGTNIVDLVEAFSYTEVAGP